MKNAKQRIAVLDLSTMALKRQITLETEKLAAEERRMEGQRQEIDSLHARVQSKVTSPEVQPWPASAA